MKPARIRMYRQGLGDCFLLTFPGASRDVRVLVDCGVLLGTPDGEAKVRKVAADVAAETGDELDVLVVTHEHWDHVSGFLQAKEVFDRLRVREVWLAWTEDPEDEAATVLAQRRARALRGVVAASARVAGGQSMAARRTAERLDGLMAFFGGAAAAADRSTAAAMRWARARPGAKVRFLRPGEEPFGVPGTDAARVFVLGPPRDPKLIRKSDPSRRSSEVYGLAGEGAADLGFLAATGALDAPASADPFDPWFRVTEKEAGQRPFFQEHYGFDGEDGWQRIEDDWLGAAGPLALQLDSDTNNTSLVLAFELLPSGRVLLFPGDAQVGNWLSWEGLTWNLGGSGGAARTVTSHDLLARTVLYKVGHHGSHNATLREKGLELMTSRELAAMLPVERTTADKRDWNMPFPSLFDRLVEKTKGRIIDRDRGMPTPPAGVADADWDAFATRTTVEEDWIEYRLDP